MLLMVELVSFSLYRFNPAAILDWHYYKSAFEHTRKPTIPYGWSSPDGLPRPIQTKYPFTCARAFGDSFTYGEEVDDSEKVWTSVASRELGCQIENYGVGGFGTDQALVLYESTKTNTHIVILGIYPEMLRRNLAASWLFYGGQKGRALKPYFKLDHQANLEQISWPESASSEDLRNYHRHDIFFKHYDVKFPYSWHLSKSIYHQMKTRLENKGFFFDKHNDALPLQLALLDEFEAQVAARGSEMALVYFPSLAELSSNNLSYIKQMEIFQDKHPQVCVIDTGPALIEAIEKGIGVGAQSGHFNSIGNAIVATEVAKGLKTCQKTKIFISADAQTLANFYATQHPLQQYQVDADRH
jgi:hypothetical protein